MSEERNEVEQRLQQLVPSQGSLSSEVTFYQAGWQAGRQEAARATPANTSGGKRRFAGGLLCGVVSSVAVLLLLPFGQRNTPVPAVMVARDHDSQPPAKSAVSDSGLPGNSNVPAEFSTPHTQSDRDEWLLQHRDLESRLLRRYQAATAAPRLVSVLPSEHADDGRPQRNLSDPEASENGLPSRETWDQLLQTL